MRLFRGTPSGIEQWWDGELWARYPLPDENGIWHYDRPDLVRRRNMALEVLYILLPPPFDKNFDPLLADAFWKEVLSKLPRRWEISEEEVKRWYAMKISPEAFTASAVVLDDLHAREIPSQVRVAVWKRDGGKCTKCGSTLNLHYDHAIPYSKGGSSSDVNNIQILCSKCNLKKRDHIE